MSYKYSNLNKHCKSLATIENFSTFKLEADEESMKAILILSVLISIIMQITNNTDNNNCIIV